MRRFVSIATVFAFFLICPGLGMVGHRLAAEPAAAVAASVMGHGDHGDHGPCHEAPAAPDHQKADPCSDLSACGAHHWVQAPPSIGPTYLPRVIDMVAPASAALVSVILAPDPFPPKRPS
jgi:hypothetical protein